MGPRERKAGYDRWVLYGLFAAVFGQLADLFFRRRRLGGQVPTEGPIIIVCNHPNGLVDPLLVIREAGRKVRFLAKEPLFRMPIIGSFLRGLYALPVYRARDGHDTSKNDETFSAVFDALEAGEAICLFPEGTSHSEPDLQPLKTGAARMALGAEARGREVGVKIVPMGLLYRDKSVFRSEAATLVGTAIEAGTFRSAFVDDPRATTLALTEAIDSAIREVTINLERWEDLPIVELAEKIFPADGRPSLDRIRILADGQRSIEARDPARIEALRRDLLDFAEEARRLGIPADRLDASYSTGAIVRFFARNLAAVLFGFPTAVAGAVAYFVPYQTTRRLVSIARPSLDLVATYKLLASLLTFPLWHCAMVIGIAYWADGFAAISASITLPLAGLYSERFLRHRSRALRELETFVRILTRRDAAAHLSRRRDALRLEMESIAATLREASTDHSSSSSSLGPTSS